MLFPGGGRFPKYRLSMSPLIETSFLVVDECSMIDIWLCANCGASSGFQNSLPPADCEQAVAWLASIIKISGGALTRVQR
jgi:hypothetical protein